MFRKVGLSALLLGLSAVASAEQWQAENVDVTFLTTKVSVDSAAVLEANTFGEARVAIDADGKISGAIALNSVQTGIEIRDERLRDLVFASVDNAELLISGQVDIAAIDQLAVGEFTTLEQPLKLHFGSHEADATAEFMVTRLADDRLSAISTKPVMVDITGFGVDEGINTLTELSGMGTISMQVPTLINATLTHVSD